MKLNTRPENRKNMAQAISEVLGTPSVYQGMPSCAYVIGSITVNRDGTIDCDEVEAILRIKPILIVNGWLAEEPELPEIAEEEETPETTDNPDAPSETQEEGDEQEMTEPQISEPTPEIDEVSITTEGEPITATDINMPIRSMSITAMTNLLRILYSRQELINKMLQEEALYIDSELMDLLRDNHITTLAEMQKLINAETDVGMVKGVRLGDRHMTFTLPYDLEEPTRWCNYALLLQAIFKLAEGAARVKTEKVVLTEENEKYHANAWMNRLGFGGPERKELRHALMDHLHGFAAFKDSGRMQAHKDKYTALRNAGRDNEAEGGTDA